MVRQTVHTRNGCKRLQDPITADTPHSASARQSSAKNLCGHRPNTLMKMRCTVGSGCPLRFQLSMSISRSGSLARRRRRRRGVPIGASSGGVASAVAASGGAAAACAGPDAVAAGGDAVAAGVVVERLAYAGGMHGGGMDAAAWDPSGHSRYTCRIQPSALAMAPSSLYLAALRTRTRKNSPEVSCSITSSSCPSDAEYSEKLRESLERVGTRLKATLPTPPCARQIAVPAKGRILVPLVTSRAPQTSHVSARATDS
mmetsp:Transcript_56672/g.106826  ORF Transcript_56672/g.106826 Transcript_56672/m.106826 type:complete len:257 (-) Transcript_56672:50-820(-)